MIKLKVLLEQIIAEIGDLDNITPYEVNDNSFTTDEGWKVEVEFQSFDNKFLNVLGVNTNIYPNPIYNVGFKIEGVQTQFTKSTYSSLVKILKTVVIVCENFMKEKKPNGLIFFAAHKKGENILDVTDPSKTRLYNAIIIKYIFKNLPNFTLVNIGNKKGFEGFMIYNKEKINK